MINREQIQGENKERFSQRSFPRLRSLQSPSTQLHASSGGTQTLSQHNTLTELSHYKGGTRRRRRPGRQHLEGACFKRSKRARNRGRISRRKCTPNEKNPLVPPERHTSDQIPGGEAPFEGRLMGFSTVYAVKSVSFNPSSRFIHTPTSLSGAGIVTASPFSCPLGLPSEFARPRLSTPSHGQFI